MDAPESPAENGRADEPLQSGLAGLLGAGLDALRTRLDLAAVELEIHLLALLRVLVCLIGAVACALLALAFALTTLVVALWDTHRTLALLGGPWCSSDSRCYSAHWARVRCATSRGFCRVRCRNCAKTSGAQGAGHDAHGGPAGAAARAVGA